MLDLSAAFDTLDHSVLLHRLEHRFGVTGTVLKWFRPFLSNRTQCISISSLPKSKPMKLVFGVPQGSVLGPILFTLYTTPLEDIFAKFDLEFMFYADDSQLYAVCNNPSDSVTVIENCISEVREWMQSNLLVLNDNKTEVVHFTSRHKKYIEHLKSLKIGGCDIIPKNFVRNLGVYFESTGYPSKHINQICKTSYFSLYKISKIRSLLDQASTVKLVHAFITSRLDYCNSVLYGSPDYEIKKLQSIQNSAARLVTKRGIFDEISPILYELHCLPIRSRITFKILLIVFNILDNRAPEYLSEFIKLHTPCRPDLRSANPNLRLLERQDTRFTTKSYGWRAFNVCAPFLLNDLPLFLRKSENVNIFIRNLKTYLFKKSFS